MLIQQQHQQPCVPSFVTPLNLNFSHSFSSPMKKCRHIVVDPPSSSLSLRMTLTSDNPEVQKSTTLQHSETLVPRDDFPILSRTINDKPLIYLDSAATSQKPRCVIDALTSYYTSTNSNVHRGAHALAAQATDSFERTRGLIASMLGGTGRVAETNNVRSDEIVYTRNATEAINLVASTWGDKNINKDDIIIVSEMEHHANLVPWQILAAKKNAKILSVPLLADTQEYDIATLEKLLNQYGEQVKLIAVSHVSNVLACMNPIEQIVSLAKKTGSKILLDACQSIPHMPVNVHHLGIDFFVASAHKMLGPTGVGFLWSPYQILESMPPYMGGGEMIRDVWCDSSTFTSPPHRFEAGTPAIGEVVAFATAIEYLQRVGMQTIHQHEQILADYLWQRLSEFQEIDIYGPPPPRRKAALCAFNVRDVHSGDLATMLDLDGIAVRSGHHCAQPLHRAVGVTSSARASLYLYNSKDEVDKLIDSMQEAVSLLGGKMTLKLL